MNDSKITEKLLKLSHELGLEPRQMIILSEGNVSALTNDGNFLVKASGTYLGSLSKEDLSLVNMETILKLLERNAMTDEEIALELTNSLLDKNHKRPSVESFLHALCLSEGEAKYVAHTHSVSVNQILCSQHGAKPFMGHLFPDAIVVCGNKPAVVPYIDPGFQLAKIIQTELKRYKKEHGKAPKLLLMENHGPIALAQTASEALNIMLMADKWAKVLWGNIAIGGAKFLSKKEVKRIDSRLDEHYRRRLLDNNG